MQAEGQQPISDSSNCYTSDCEESSALNSNEILQLFSEKLLGSVNMGVKL